LGRLGRTPVGTAPCEGVAWTQIFRPVADWEGSATVHHDGQVHEVWVRVSVLRRVMIGADRRQHDDGHRIWTARVSGPPLEVGAEVTVTLSGGKPIGARVGVDRCLSGAGVPAPLAGAT